LEVKAWPGGNKAYQGVAWDEEGNFKALTLQVPPGGGVRDRPCVAVERR
jgi:hypothetical protein